jgi:hypothetical protein
MFLAEPRAQSDARCHFDQREKSFLDPSHSFGMTRLNPSPSRAPRLCASHHIDIHVLHRRGRLFKGTAERGRT